MADYTIPLPSPVSNLRLGAFALSPGIGFQFAVSNADGTPITPAEQSRIGISSTTNLWLVPANWTMLTNPMRLTNGFLQVSDTNSLLYPQRFYRAVATP